MAADGNVFLICQDDNGVSNVNVRFEGEDVWLAAEQIRQLFQASQQDVHHHIQQIYADGELSPEATNKKYLLVRIVSQFHDFAELQALEMKPMRMEEWVRKLDALLTLSGRQLLTGPGKISHEEACRKAVAEFREYRRRLRHSPYGTGGVTSANCLANIQSYL